MALLSVADQLKEGKEEIRGTGGGGTFDDGRRGSKTLSYSIRLTLSYHV